jgi:hypothetical protein
MIFSIQNKNFNILLFYTPEFSVNLYKQNAPSLMLKRRAMIIYYRVGIKMQVDNNRLYMLVTPICYSLLTIHEANNGFRACGSSYSSCTHTLYI